MYTWKSYFVVQSDYQHWANEVLFSSLDHLNGEAIGADHGLFFNSIHHTVDHMLMVSQSWLARLKGESLSVDYKVINHPDWRELKIALRRETRKLQAWLESQPVEFFDSQIGFTGGDGKTRTMWVRDVLAHLFTHYAHHRGRFPPWRPVWARLVRKWISSTTGARWSGSSTRPSASRCRQKRCDQILQPSRVNLAGDLVADHATPVDDEGQGDAIDPAEGFRNSL